MSEMPERVDEMALASVGGSEPTAERAFRLTSDTCDAVYEPGSPVLFVTFDNTATIGRADPPQPWLRSRVREAGYSLLGLAAKRKDWYRNTETPAALRQLQTSGFFVSFERIIFIGSSMGGYAALTYSRLVPGAVVVAFAPQSTLNTKLAPFERRYRYARRKWDWDTPDYMDAADAVEVASEVILILDPLIPEDAAHADRLTGPNVRRLDCRHFGHRAIRGLAETGYLDTLIEDIGRGEFRAEAFHRAMRARRRSAIWRRTFLAAVCDGGSDFRTGIVARAMLHADPSFRPARRALRNLSLYRPATDIQAPEGIDLAENAILVPERAHDRRLACGVISQDGTFVEASRCHVRARLTTAEPTLGPDEAVDRIDGTYLFGGHLRGHFGHFLVESLGRLWAAEALHGRFDGVAYLPFRGNAPAARKAFDRYGDLLRRLVPDAPFLVVDQPVRVERLYLPEIGFGWNALFAGTPAFRAFARSRLTKELPPSAGDRVYISRTGLGAGKGGVLGESILERRLQAEGYTILHPERESLDIQLAHYASAREIVALDGSALHLAGFVAQPGTRVAMILRRSNANQKDYLRQFRAFAGIEIDVIDALVADWTRADASRADFSSMGELDFARVFAALAGLGYVQRAQAEVVPSLPAAPEGLVRRAG